MRKCGSKCFDQNSPSGQLTLRVYMTPMKQSGLQKIRRRKSEVSPQGRRGDSLQAPCSVFVINSKCHDSDGQGWQASRAGRGSLGLVLWPWRVPQTPAANVGGGPTPKQVDKQPSRRGREQSRLLGRLLPGTRTETDVKTQPVHEFPTGLKPRFF